MRRLMAAPWSVAVLMTVAMFVATAVTAQPVQTPPAPAGTTAAASSTAAPAATAPAQPAASATPATAAPAASATPATAAPAASTGGDGVVGATTNTVVKDEPVDAGTYSVRLRDLEQRINELKEQVFRSKARLSLLAETVLQGVVAGGQAQIIHENKMGSSFKLVKVLYALDGAPIFNQADEEGSLGDREEFEIYNGSIVPGDHTLTVQLEYRGSGYGIFSYLKGYRFKVNSSHTFSAPEGKMSILRVVGYEKGGPTAPLEERPAIRYVERILEGAQSGAAQAGAGGG